LCAWFAVTLSLVKGRLVPRRFFIKWDVLRRAYYASVCEIKESAQMSRIFAMYLRGQSVTSAEKAFAKNQICDVFRGLGIIGLTIIPVPLFLPLFVYVARIFFPEFHLLPESFRNSFNDHV